MTDADLSSAYSYDSQGRVQRIANAAVTRTFSYDSYSRLNSESVTVDSLTRTSSYGYDNYHRPTTVTYHGGEVVTTSYGSPGAAVGLSSSVHGTLVDRVSYDEAGRMTALRLPAAGNLWRTQRYYPWTAKRNGGMLESLKVGLSEGAGERLNRSYAYNYFGDIIAQAFASARQMRSQKLSALTEETTNHKFTYDGLGRLTAASGSYNRTYSYDGANRLDLPPMFVPPVMLVRQARGQGRQARGPQAPATSHPHGVLVILGNCFNLLIGIRGRNAARYTTPAFIL
ncbi:MAG: hypothetical protein F4X14_01730 [Caldilineaceae bacterium SB0661_bin_32]|uniref:Teneurin-like YD-shell domain-containing protein n=1 Tax=Caldilineaceae bacterium SB0661_bin_32 TaxID=2605255 RepID=A0A6B1D246_9CHLR|nr:hypothetical protein [Caldilineaceae bacterium SB0661_bin_32]